MYKSCYLDTKNDAIVTGKAVKREHDKVPSCTSLGYFKSEIEALICLTLVKLQRQLISSKHEYQMVIKKRVSFEYLPSVFDYPVQAYRFAFAVSFYSLFDVWEEMKRTILGADTELCNANAWTNKVQKAVIHTLNDIASHPSDDNLDRITIYIDYMKGTPDERLEQQMCFHNVLLADVLDNQLSRHCLIVAGDGLAWYKVPFPITDLSGLSQLVTKTHADLVGSQMF
jgi:hypothetical protein